VTAGAPAAAARAPSSVAYARGPRYSEGKHIHSAFSTGGRERHCNTTSCTNPMSRAAAPLPRASLECRASRRTSLTEEDAMETTQRLSRRGSWSGAEAAASAAAAAVATQPVVSSLHRPCVTRMGIALVRDPIRSDPTLVPDRRPRGACWRRPPAGAAFDSRRCALPRSDLLSGVLVGFIADGLAIGRPRTAPFGVHVVGAARQGPTPTLAGSVFASGAVGARTESVQDRKRGRVPTAHVPRVGQDCKDGDHLY
jgi:hypothetical protein